MSRDWRLGRQARVHRASLVVVLVGVVLSVAASLLARKIAAESERRLINDDVGIAATAVQSLATQVHGDLNSSLAVLRATNGDSVAFRRFAATTSIFGGTWWVLRHDRGKWVPLFGNQIGANQDDQRTGLAKVEMETGSTFYILGFVGSGASRSLAAGEMDPSATFLVYVLINLPLAASLAPSATANTGFGADLAYAVYTSGDERMSAVPLANTSQLPLGGQRVVTVLDVDTGNVGPIRYGTAAGNLKVPENDLLFVVSPRRFLAGQLAEASPWILLIVILVLALAVATTVEVVIRRRDDALVVVAHLKSKNDELDRVLEERARAERTRSELEERLRSAQRMEVLGRLAGGLAHDFNNLLSVILNFGSFAVEALEGHDAKPDVDEMVGAARRAADLTRKLLLFSRQDRLEARAVDLNATVSGIERILQGVVGEQVGIEFDLAPSAPLVWADEGEIEQAIMNLAMNARDAMVGVDGVLTIRTFVSFVSDGVARGAPAHAGSRSGQARVPDNPRVADGSYGCLQVVDNGAGMSSDVLGRAFEPFFTTKPRGVGTGLGLSTVFALARRWGGDLQAASERGRGTTILIWLPIATTSPKVRNDETTEHDTGGTASGRVLVVEDQEGVRKAARRILERAGYQVVDAGDAASALAVIGETPIDVLLTDVVMPGGSGVALVDELERRQSTIRVVYMSGYAPAVLSQSRTNGVPLVEKPFTATTLIEAIDAAVAGGGGSVAARGSSDASRGSGTAAAAHGAGQGLAPSGR